MENIQMGCVGERAGRAVLSQWGGLRQVLERPHPASRNPKQMFPLPAGGRWLPAGTDHGRPVMLSPGASLDAAQVLGRRTKTETCICCPRSCRRTRREKYCLSPKACRGILRRAQKRGKELPEVLRIALERQAFAMKAERPAVE